MTYKEFKEIIEREHGYVVEQREDFCNIRNDKTNVPIALIHLSKRHSMDTYLLTDEDDMRFMAYNWTTISEFVATPVEDRYPGKKYYVKLDLPKFIGGQNLYLNKNMYAWNLPAIDYTIDTKAQYEYDADEGGMYYQTQFTMEEIGEIIPEKDRNKFKFIPVEEEI